MKSTFARNAVINHLMGKASFTMPSTVYAALAISAITPATTGGTISEATYSGYARVAVPAASLSTASGGNMTNTVDILWPEVQSGSDIVVSVAFCTAAAGGEILYYDADVGSVEVSTTQSPPTIKAGALSISEE